MLQRVDTRAHADARPEGAKLRVLIASYRSAPHVGGQGVYVRELSAALADLGHEVSVASGPPYPELDPRITLVRLPSLDLYSVKNGLMALRWRHFLSWADLSEYIAHNTGAFGEIASFGRRLRRYLRDNPGRYDVVHDNQSFAAALPRVVADGVPVVATLHHPITRDLAMALERAPGPLARYGLRRWHNFLKMQARSARRLRHILCVSDAARQSAAEDFGLDPARVTVAFNGVDQAVFRSDATIERDPNRIVSTASADLPLKGLNVLIGAFAQIAERFPDAKLTVIGRLRDGEAKDRLERSELAGRVTFISGLSKFAVAEQFHRASFYVCPSLFEGFGLPAAEAMSCGAPVIVTTGGALPEVAGDAGIVVPAGDETALAEAMTALLADPDRRAAMSTASLARAPLFSWPEHARAAVALYHKAMMETGTPGAIIAHD